MPWFCEGACNGHCLGERLIYGVDDIETSVNFFTDFGLTLAARDSRAA